MLNNPFSYPITSSMTVHRMRYRGPIESYKKNKFSTDSAKDISILEKHINSCHDDLKRYISDTLTECTSERAIYKNGSAVFNGICSANMELLSNKKDNILKTSRGVKE